MTTLLLGADWITARWQAGAALSQSWRSGSHGGDGNRAEGEFSSAVTGLIPLWLSPRPMAGPLDHHRLWLG